MQLCQKSKHSNILDYWIFTWRGKFETYSRNQCLFGYNFQHFWTQLKLKLLERSIFSYFYEKNTDVNNRKNIHNFLKYIASTWIVPSFIKIYFFVKSYETFLLFNLASVFLCFDTTMCYFILETTYCHLIGWSTKKKISFGKV